MRRGKPATRRLAGDGGLEGDEVQERGLDHLSFGDGCRDFQQWFASRDRPTLRYSPNIASELQVQQPLLIVGC